MKASTDPTSGGPGRRKAVCEARPRSRSGAGVCTTSLASLLAGCSAAPSQDILGSYFPGWIACLALGAVVCRQLLVAIGVNGFVLAPLLTYLAIAGTITLLVWLLRFGG